ncbi:hypothetical protein [uncultured Vagococcus sp.]|uniref:hypothetical protein n=1 Tax=uncultured Vagococcus sp. TaxID=189676 RepID=UPI0028D630DF|nr:hypothetical protein [uncultured Vagococcus sp.]
MKKLDDLEVDEFIKRVEALVESWKTCSYQLCVNQIKILELSIKEDTTGVTDLYEEMIEIGYRVLNQRIRNEQLVPQ